jgi:hypothetical protein
MKRASRNSNQWALYTRLLAAAVLWADSIKVAEAMANPKRHNRVSVNFGEAKKERNLFIPKPFTSSLPGTSLMLTR